MGKVPKIAAENSIFSRKSPVAPRGKAYYNKMEKCGAPATEKGENTNG